MSYIVVFTIFCVINVVCTQNANPVVRSAHGILNGSWKVSSNGRNYAAFEGVPYARPPAGKYRFREPQKMKPWLGVWDATRKGSACLQYDPFEGKVIGSEDCLFLNVYTPTVNAASSLPVIVYIHGGAFMYGSGNLYSPAYFMDRDVVVVTVNYRLGPLGFLSTGDDMVPGNMGLKDQAFALQWVRDNILMFGGDPNQVTLIGCSAGGASVNYQYLTPLTKGTFNRGIAFSGSAYSSWTFQTRPLQKAKALAAVIGCPTTTTTKEMVDCLRFRPGESVVNAQISLFDWKVHMFTVFTPTAEPSTSRQPFITQPPFTLMESGLMHKLPLMTTVTSEEGLYPAAWYQRDHTTLPELETRWDHLAANIFEYNDTSPLTERATVAKKIKDHYLQGKAVSQETFPQLVQALSDRLFIDGVGRLARTHAAKSGQPTYVYRYAYRGEKSLSNPMALDSKNYGVSHADDIFHLFEYPGLEVTRADDKIMKDVLLDIVYSYATTGVPKVQGVDWTAQPATGNEVKYLNIAGPNSFQMMSSMDFGQNTFWSSLGFMENENAHLMPKDEL